jgi:2-polyprenyl-3-methyl-5-hydroxy-6-metoxy-1,4-benzoquinol methylase
MSHKLHLEKNIRTFNEREVTTEFEWQHARIEKICSILWAIPNKTSGADIGCLGGMATSRYAATGIKTMHGYDISPTSLGQLQSQGFEGFYWNVDGEKCPAPDHTYDIIIAGEIIEHLVDTDSFAGELHRILKPEGHLIVSTPNLTSWYNRLRLLRGHVPVSYPGTSSTIRKDLFIDNNHIRLNALSEWIYFFERHGFEVRAVYGTSHLQVMQGGWRTRLFKFIDRLSWKYPALAVNIILVMCKGPNN